MREGDGAGGGSYRPRGLRLSLPQPLMRTEMAVLNAMRNSYEKGSEDGRGRIFVRLNSGKNLGSRAVKES